jgi:hypothetical protein
VAFKLRPERADTSPMAEPPVRSTWSQGGGPPRTTINGDSNYSLLADEQLIIERDRKRKELDEVTMHPGSSPAVGHLLVSIEREVERISDELLRRARSRHPSIRSLSARLRIRS